jgi:hypothetical protein
LESICKELLSHCLEGTPWPGSLIARLRERLLHGDDEDSRLFFSIVIERLGDLFEPRLCTVYARLMSELLESPELLERYAKVREPRPFVGPDPAAVYVLSRITLGADVAVTSVVLDAAKRRFPNARILLAGPRKNWELFAADPRIEWHEASYGRSARFADRIAARPWIDAPDALILDPDSRLSQLGLLPVTPLDDRYRFFESRGYLPDSGLSMPELASAWCVATLGVGGVAYVAPRSSTVRPAAVTANLGVGGNDSKRFPDPFEAELLRAFSEDTLIDLGGSDEEAERVRRAAGPTKRTFQGSFADFAWLISQSRLYAGYDSAGMHVAAACGVPLVCFFAGEVCERFFERWRPTGPGPIDVVRKGPDALEDALRAVTRLRPE